MEDQNAHLYKIVPDVLRNNNKYNLSNGVLFNPFQIGTSYNMMVPKIHVLVVDSDRKSLISTSELLERGGSYQVTRINLASRAMKMISTGKKHFDVVIADINSDMDGFQFCHQVVKQGTLVVLTSAVEEACLAYKAIENGALLFIQKPMNEHIIKYLWQFVMKERLKKSKGEEEMATKMILNGRGKGIVINEGKGKKIATNEASTVKEKNGNRIVRLEVDQRKIQKRAYKKRKESENTSINPSSNKASTRESVFEANYNRKKICTEWTKELHAKFMNAVNQLGDGKCYPKEILEIMNVPGLTRMQVASHLQKCRHDSWRSPDERKHRSRMCGSVLGENNAKEKERMRVFGSMPRGQDKILSEKQQSSLKIPLHSNLTSSESIIQDMPIYEDEDVLFPNLENMNVEDMNSLIWDVDKRVALWEETLPASSTTSATYSANVFGTNPCSRYSTRTMIALDAPEPTKELDFNQRVAPPPEESEQAIEIEHFFNNDVPNFDLPSGIDNDSRDENFSNNLPSLNPK